MWVGHLYVVLLLVGVSSSTVQQQGCSNEALAQNLPLLLDHVRRRLVLVPELQLKQLLWRLLLLHVVLLLLLFMVLLWEILLLL